MKKIKSLPKELRDIDSGPNPIDVHVGQRIRMRRSFLGYSQEKLAEVIGISFQQIQKYERGTNRVSASRLYQLSRILSVPIDYFYENFSKSPSGKPSTGLADNEQESFESEDIMGKKETMDLIRVYYSIPDPKLRKDLFNMIKSMATSMKQEKK